MTQAKSGVNGSLELYKLAFDPPFFLLTTQMASRQILKLSSFKTASRCWMPVPVSSVQRNFSSKQRIINTNLHSLSDVNLISNDEILLHEQNHHTTNRIVSGENGQDEVHFEPIVYSADEIHTAGPVNKA